MSSPSVHHLLEAFVNQLYFCDDDAEIEAICKKLKIMMDDQSRVLPTMLFSNLISKFVESGILLLNFDAKDWRYKSVGLLILDKLLDVNIEIMAERRIEIVNQLRKVLEFEKLPLDTYAVVLRRAAVSIGHLARVASTTEIEYLQDYYVANSIKWLADHRLETRRYAGAVLITELAMNSPALIFVCRKNFFLSIWDVVFDKTQRLREAAARALRAALVLVGEREYLGDYIVKCMNQVNIGFTINTPEKVHGSLLIIECLITKSVISTDEFLTALKGMDVAVQDFFWSVLQKKDYREQLVKTTIIELIPKLAELSPATFINSNKYTGSKSFLIYSVSFLLEITNSRHKDRPLAFISLGGLFVAVSHSPVGVAAIETDIFQAVEFGFQEPFCIEALKCLAMVVQVSKNSKRYIREQFVNSMFDGGLTSDLIDSLKEVNKYVASVRSFVQSRLRSLITNILLSHSVVLDPIPTNFNTRTPPNVVGKSQGGRRHSSLAAQSPLTTGGSTNSTPPGPTQHHGFFRDFFSGSAPSVTGLHIRRRLFGVGSGVHGLTNDVATDEEIILALKVLASFDFISSRKQLQLSQTIGSPDRALSISVDSGTKNRTECAMLLRVVREGVVRYLDDSNPDVRSAAAVTCAVVMDKVVRIVETDLEMEECLLQIMNRLLMLGVGDDYPGNRISVFTSLTPSLDHVITASDNVNCLVDALNDESFEVRTAAMIVLSRVAHFDNVHVMPLVRLILSKIMQQVQDSKDHQMQLESVRLLRAMAVGMDSLIIPYISLLLTPLLQLLQVQITAIRSSALATIGELAKTSPEDVRPHLDIVFPAVIELIESDTTSSENLETSMTSLCNICSSLGLVSEPYSDYPDLFKAIVKVIHKTDSFSEAARLLGIRAIGLMGAVSAKLYSSSGINGAFEDYRSMNLNDNLKKDKKIRAQGDLSLVFDAKVDQDDKLISLDKYYVDVVMQALTNILRDGSLATHHQTVVKVGMQIVRTLGQQGVNHLDEFVSAVVSRVYSADSVSVQEGLLENIVVLIYVFNSGIIRHLPLIVKLSCDMLSYHIQICLDIVEAICTLTPPQHYNGAMREVLPLLIQTIRAELIQDMSDSTAGGLNQGAGGLTNSSQPNGDSLPRSNSRSNSDANANQLSPGFNRVSSNPSNQVDSSKKQKPLFQTWIILKTLANVAPYLKEYSQQLIPIVLSVVEDKLVKSEVRRDALCVAMHLAMDGRELQVYAGRLIHSVLRILDSDNQLLQASAFIALSTILCKIGPAFLPFVVTAKRKISTILSKEGAHKFFQMEEYESLLNRLLNQLPLPAEPSDASLNFLKSDARSKMLADRAKSSQQSINVNLQTLETAWTLSGRITTSDLVEWMRRSSIELIRQSPSPIINPCAVLAKVYQPLATELFNAAFVSVWTEYFAAKTDAMMFSDEVPLINSLETALKSPQIPDNIRTAVLNLAEFLEMQGKQLPIDLFLLATQAQAANMFAKCLHYREMEFGSKSIAPSKECIEALITVNRQLNLRDAASGVLEIVRTNFSNTIPIQPRWLEKLHCWEEARLLYLTENLTDGISSPGGKKKITHDLGLLRCLRALGDHEELVNGAQALFKEMEISEAHISTEELDETLEARQEVQRLGAHASWILGKWDIMEEFLGDSKPISSGMMVGNRRTRGYHIDLENNTSFYVTVLLIHKRKYGKALNLIMDTRKELAANFSSLLTESYSRACRAMVSMQLLTELEEIVTFKEYVADAVASRNVANVARPDVDPSLGLTFVINDELAAEIKERKANLIYKFRARMESAPSEVEVLRQILNVHSILLEPQEDLDSWLQLVNLCKKNDMLVYCENILRSLGAPLTEAAHANPSVQPVSVHPRVMYHTYKFFWAKGERTKALNELSAFLAGMAPVPIDPDSRTMKVKCLLKKAEWAKALADSSSEQTTGLFANDILSLVREARDLANEQYSVWHAWAVTNFDQLQSSEASMASVAGIENSNNATEDLKIIKERLRGMSVKDDLSERLRSADSRGHRRTKSLSGFDIGVEDLPSIERTNTNLIIEAIKGFVRSIMLGREQPVANVLQDILRLLTLWFSYGTRSNVFVVLNSELENVPPESWLGVVPQLIARMHVKIPEISGPLRRLLIKISAAHPQALVCPISVAMNTSDAQRKNLAADIINAVRKCDSQLVDEAAMVSKELMRVAITAHEFWHQGLERAAHLYIVEKDISGMIHVLQQLHDAADVSSGHKDDSLPSSPIFSVQRGNDNQSGYTLMDLSFQNSFGSSLAKAQKWLQLFRGQRKNLLLLHQAWSIYYDVFKKIALQLKNLKYVELSHVSPALTAASGLCLAVPGTYQPFRDLVCITKFAAAVDVISSKQRPRRITITGSDGSKYRFLLKGHEDLRQDERVMQLFGLINACLANKRATRHMGLKIVRYSVLPLSNNSGLIGWVENCDTLNQLIKTYRETKGIKLNVEHRLLMEKAPNYEKLPFLHKVSCFQEVIDATKGEDISKMLWLKSKTSEIWIERRTNYTKSLAVNSMAGYILGLGDRHPSNLMLDRITGRIVHIDFGDCFEVAMNRSKFPEKIPFRLTRMLIKAMEISGIEGTYRTTCRRVMGVLRDNRDSVMAMLEAFVYDPLISWRLMADSGAGGNTNAADDHPDAVDAASKSTVDVLISDLKKSITVSESQLTLHTEGDPSSAEVVNGNLATQNGETSAEFSSVLPAAQSTIVGDSIADDKKFQKMKTDEQKPLDIDNLNTRAMEVILRIQSKLNGRDFNKANQLINDDLSVDEQVDRLIQEAVSVENLCELFVGWCPLW